MQRWILLGAIGGLVAGVLSGLMEGVLEGGIRLAQIGEEMLLWSVGLAVGAGAASLPVHWASRGAVGGLVFGGVRAALTTGLALSPDPWPVVLGGEVAGGLVGGLLLAYLWQSPPEAPPDSE
ncbi:MAG: hypothetical protein R6T83_11990 [Salinibacter sp.]